jgi:hypothetical protein
MTTPADQDVNAHLSGVDPGTGIPLAINRFGYVREPCGATSTVINRSTLNSTV